MISDRSYQSIMEYHCNFITKRTSQKCDEAMNYAINHEFRDIDQYNIYTPSYMALPNSTKSSISLCLKNKLVRRWISRHDPCTQNYANKYYNQPEVYYTMHAHCIEIPYKWTTYRFFSQIDLIFLNFLWEILACDLYIEATPFLFCVYVGQRSSYKELKWLSRLHVTYIQGANWSWSQDLGFQVHIS